MDNFSQVMPRPHSKCMDDGDNLSDHLAICRGFQLSTGNEDSPERNLVTKLLWDKAQTPLIRFVVDLSYSLLYNLS